MRIIWIRHGLTDWNKEFRLHGTSDVPLNNTGLTQARELAYALLPAPDAVFISPMARAREFARPLLEKHGLEPVALEELREICFGLWEGLRYADMDEKNRKLFEAWHANPSAVSPPQGEETTALLSRVKKAIDLILTQKEKHHNIAVVTHGGVIRMALILLAGMTLSDVSSLRIDPASMTVVEKIDGGWKLLKLNGELI